MRSTITVERILSTLPLRTNDTPTPPHTFVDTGLLIPTPRGYPSLRVQTPIQLVRNRGSRQCGGFTLLLVLYTLLVN